MAGSGVTFSLQRLMEHAGLTSTNQVMRAFGASGRDVKACLVDGLGLVRAETWAERAGFHPSEVWPEWTRAILSAEEPEVVKVVCRQTKGSKVCAAPDCTTRFVPPKKVQRKKYCSTRCKSRTAARVRYQKDAEWREHIKAERRKFYAETREYSQVQKRRRRAGLSTIHRPYVEVEGNERVA